jgi:hypothetical protein
MNIDLRLEWCDGDPQLEVTRSPQGLEVVVDPRLSHDQVRAACEEIDGWGDQVLLLWEQAVGVTQEPAT